MDEFLYLGICDILINMNIIYYLFDTTTQYVKSTIDILLNQIFYR